MLGKVGQGTLAAGARFHVSQSRVREATSAVGFVSKKARDKVWSFYGLGCPIHTFQARPLDLHSRSFPFDSSFGKGP